MKRFLFLLFLTILVLRPDSYAKETYEIQCLADSDAYVATSSEVIQLNHTQVSRNNRDRLNKSKWATRVFPCMACVYLLLAAGFLYWVCRYRWKG